MDETQPTVFDLFSGIGGFSLAFAAEGFRVLAHAEIEPYAASVLHAHWPQVPNVGDITKLNGDEFIKRFGISDVLTAGVPCQPASLLGARRGTADHRWLWPDTLRIVRELRPQFCLFENPPALLTLEGGRAFNGIISGLSALGYVGCYDVLPAAAVGAGHLRERLFILAAHSDMLGLERHTRHETSQSYSANSTPVGPPLVRGLERPDWLQTQSPVAPLVHGLSGGLVEASVRCVGNAVVPQIVQIYARAIRQLI